VVQGIPGTGPGSDHGEAGGGGMMGAGLYTLLGLASYTAGVWLPLAFVVGGVVSVFSVYSYAKLGAKYPSRGGPRTSSSAASATA
jgi:amino acid transporter